MKLEDAAAKALCDAVLGEGTYDTLTEDQKETWKRGVEAVLDVHNDYGYTLTDPHTYLY